MKKIKLLYVTYHFPPVGQAASIRALKLSNALYDYDIESIIVTQNIEFEDHLHRLPDYSLWKEVNKKTRVLRARYFSPTIFHIPIKILNIFQKLFKLTTSFFTEKATGSKYSFTIPKDPLIPDHYIEWLPSVLWKIFTKRKIIKQIDVILVTAPPFSLFFIGLFLKSFLKKPLIIEYRDPFTFDPLKYTLGIKQRVNQLLEYYFLKTADAIVCGIEYFRDELIKKYKNDAFKNKILVIRSAFDPKDFQGLKEVKHKKNDFILTITTSLYRMRNPNPFFEGISRLKKSGDLEGLNFEFNIYGYNPIHYFEDKLRELDIMDLVNFKGFVPHDECLKALKNSTLNVDIGEKVIDYPAPPYHTWEYVASGKKYFYLGEPNTFKANFVEGNDIGIVLPRNNPEIIYEKMKKVISEFKMGKLDTKIPDDVALKFTWKSRVLKLQALVKFLAEKSKEG
ncbi:MAG: glycosyltransferase [Candidatus Hodarchaeota archaeon]